ncbi:MAG: ABC transporter permease [Leptotrichiaceae bacterium]|nr:ABC transporter permease [Leptotrichiaceae bacterium]MBP7101207.1 ABC transporter permease [Leptotrichiaceae bacterium]
MDFLELLKLSIGNLFSYKIRSFLTMLGIIIGISAVVMMSSLGAGVKENIVGDLNKLGVGNFEISIDTSPGQSYKTEDLLTTKDIEKLKKIEGIEAVSPTSSSFARLNINENRRKFFMLTGVTEDYFKISNYTIIKGRKFLPNEYRKDGKYLLLDSTTAEEMFHGENPIGEKITINFRQNSQTVTIVGIFKDPYASLAGIGGAGGRGGTPAIGLLPNNYLNHINGNEEDKYTKLQAKASDANSLSLVMETVRRDLIRRGSELDTYSVSSSSQGLDQFNNILNMLSLFISGVAAISLFVGGIGVMNIMLVSVTERIREVGLRKAIGAKTKDILTQFLIEAVLLTFLGGIIGVLFGYGGALLIGLFINTTPILNPIVVIVSLLVSTMTGLIFGVYPAKKAASLDPIEALRVD